MALVQITHYDNEARIADRTLALSASSDNMVMVAQVAVAAERRACRGGPHPGAGVARAGHEYAHDTPGEHRPHRRQLHGQLR